MTDYKHIYNFQADLYDKLVSREDYQNNLFLALEDIRPVANLKIVDMGTGTGRLSRLLAPMAASILAVDVSIHMLSTAQIHLKKGGYQNWNMAVADNRLLPLPGGIADVAIAGWSFGHFASWYEGTWFEEIAKALSEMFRILRPGGTAIIIETLGTGRELPQAPTKGLAAYYDFLERDNGFSSRWIRTDYRFSSLAEARRLVQFFFGEDLAYQVAKEKSIILPECTGIWWRTR